MASHYDDFEEEWENDNREIDEEISSERKKLQQRRELCNNIEYIVTHNGKAHRDEFYSCCVALYYLHNVPIYRRQPTTIELASPKFLVLDVGKSFDLKLLNFDHHQFSAKVDCTFTQLVRFFDMEEEFNVYPWVKFLKDSDNLGLTKAAKSINLEFLPQALKSPVEEILLQLFSSYSEIYNGDLYNIMKIIGVRLIKNAINFYGDYKCFNANIIYIDGLKGFFSTTYINPSIMDLKREKKYKNKIDFCIYKRSAHDEYYCEWILYRYNDSKLDFNLIRNDDKVKYVTENGHMAILNADKIFNEEIIIKAKERRLCDEFFEDFDEFEEDEKFLEYNDDDFTIELIEGHLAEEVLTKYIKKSIFS